MITTGRRRRSTAALAAVCALALGACAEEEPQRVSATAHNGADVAFATDMIQHHAQALSMVDLTRGRPLEPEVELLVEDIRAIQAPEIETMTGWLRDWDEEIPETMRDHVHAGHGHGEVAESMEGVNTDLPGMLDAEEMAALENAADEEFQALWLAAMIEHHEGAIAIATAEQDDGRYAPAIDLAREITGTQTEQVETMRALVE